jgi:excisionase family DNA binding protein
MPPDVTPRLLLTVAEAAETLSLGKSLVYTLLATGEIESVRIGRARRIPVEALQHYVNTIRNNDKEQM